MAKRPAAVEVEEVADLESAPAPTPAKEMDLVGGLAFVAFAGLVVAFVLGQMALNKYFGAGLFK
jgi:hypothetical protein